MTLSAIREDKGFQEFARMVHSIYWTAIVYWRDIADGTYARDHAREAFPGGITIDNRVLEPQPAMPPHEVQAMLNEIYPPEMVQNHINSLSHAMGLLCRFCDPGAPVSDGEIARFVFAEPPFDALLPSGVIGAIPHWVGNLKNMLQPHYMPDMEPTNWVPVLAEQLWAYQTQLPEVYAFDLAEMTYQPAITR
ncbi:MAG: hypothetical protein J0L97_06805 [Alphaproteobacteria bacterium]|nr:hypothetical protein [Alphaproteobacteria bacterium]